MNRYLMKVSYMGRPFMGSQRQVKRTSPPTNDPTTVQGTLEMALQELNPTNDPIVVMASRTDKDVSALAGACHVDLYRDNGFIYNPNTITLCLNRYFKKQDIPIRILRTFMVPNTFHCHKNSISRTYLYRVIVNNKVKTERQFSPLIDHRPMEELRRSLFYCTNSFDLNVLREAAKLFEGFHDFRTFMGKVPYYENKSTRRTIEYIKIVENKPFLYTSYSWPEYVTNRIEDCLFLDIYIKSKGFLYKQVRRTVATLLACAQGKLTIRDIKFMLEIPSANSWLVQISTVPGTALYLCEVEYSKEDWKQFKTTL